MLCLSSCAVLLSSVAAHCRGGQLPTVYLVPSQKLPSVTVMVDSREEGTVVATRYPENIVNHWVGWLLCQTLPNLIIVDERSTDFKYLLHFPRITYHDMNLWSQRTATGKFWLVFPISEQGERHYYRLCPGMNAVLCSRPPPPPLHNE